MRNLFNTKFKLVGLAAAFMLLFGLAYMAGTISTSRNSAFAQATTPGQTATPTQTATNPQPTTGAAEVTDGTEATEPAGSTLPEVDNQAALQAQAKITPDQAKQAALAKVPGTVVSATLDGENGKIAYTVVITPTAGGANQEVKIDGNDGTVLKVEAGEQGESGGTEN